MFRKSKYQIASIKDLDNFINQVTTGGIRGMFDQNIMAPKILEIYNIYREGNKFLNGGNYALAIRYYQQALQLAPSFVAARCNLGKALELSGDLQQALVELTAAANHVQNDPDIWNLIGDVYLKLNNTQSALSAYKLCININPNHVNGIIGLGICFSRIGKFEEAETIYKKALVYIELNTMPGFTGHAWDVEKFNLYYNLFIVTEHQKKNYDAINYLEKCVALNPNDPELNRMLNFKRQQLKG